MLKMAKRLRARVADSERKTAAAAADIAAEAALAAAALAEPREPLAAKPPTPPKSAGRHGISEKQRKKLEKKLLEQRKKEEKQLEKERKKLEKMLKKTKLSDAPEKARRAEAAAAAFAATFDDMGAAQGAAAFGEGAAGEGTSRAWAQWEADEDDEDDDDYYALPHVRGIVWRPRSLKAGILRAQLPLVVFLFFSVRSPSWVLNLMLQRRTEPGRGCGFLFGATCCLQMFLGCAFFSFWSTRARRRGICQGRSGARGAFGSAPGAQRHWRRDLYM